MTKWLYFLLLTFVAVSCKKEASDQQPPVLEADPSLNGASFNQGSPFVFRYTASDDAQLRDIRIQWEHKTGNWFDLGLNPWEGEEVIGLSGTQDQARLEGTVPANAQPGLYVLSAVASDVDGRKSTTIVREFSVVNPDNILPPVATLTSPAIGGTSILAGSNLPIAGLCSDDDGLKVIAIKIVRTSPPGEGTLLYSQQFTTFNNPRLVQLNESVNIPATTSPGTAELYLLAVDSNNNSGGIRRTITIR